MPGYPRARFIARVDGARRALLSAEQRASGDLTIILKHGTNQEKEGVNVAIKEDRISVHRSPHSEGQTIKRTSRLADGNETTTVAFVTGNKDQLFFPIMGRLCPDLRIPHYSYKARASDRIIRLVDDVPETSSLIYHVFVASRDVPVPVDLVHKHKIAEFSIFKVIVYRAFANLPAFNFESNVLITTSGMRVNGVDLQPVETVDVGLNSMPSGHVSSFLYDSTQTLVAAQMRTLMNYVGESRLVEAMPDWRAVYTTEPLGQRDRVILRPRPAFEAIPPKRGDSEWPVLRPRPFPMP